MKYTDKNTHSTKGGAPVIGFTSGTTNGLPSKIPYWTEDKRNEIQMERDWRHMGLQKGDYVLVMGLSFRGGIRRGMDPYKTIGAIPIIFQHHPKYIPNVIDAIRKYKPKVFSHLSNPMIMAFENYFEHSGEDPREVFSCFKSVLTGGEHLSDRYKALIESWGIDLYQCTTIGDLYVSVDCSEHRGFRVHEDLLKIETTEEGEMVVSTVGDCPEPYVNFKTGDIVEIDRTPCSCGSSLHFKILGRTAYQIDFKGTKVYPLDFQRVIENIPETRAGIFQITRPQENDDSLIVVVGHELLTIDDETSLIFDDVSLKIRNAFDIPLTLIFKPVEELLKLGPPHKIPRII